MRRIPSNNTNQPEQIVAGGVAAIAAGGHHSLFLNSDGSLWAMGENDYGELGDGFVDNGFPYGTAAPEQIFHLPVPVLTETISSKTNLQFMATCQFGGIFYLLSGTNLGQTLSQWTPVWTNDIINREFNIFTATLTKAVNSRSQQFFIFQSP